MSTTKHPTCVPRPPATLHRLDVGYKLRPHEAEGNFYGHVDCGDRGLFQLSADGGVYCACCGERLHSLRVSLVEDYDSPEAH